MTARNRRITEKDLLPGDVLLSCGEGWLSELIRAIDHGKYSHAGFWDGTYSIDATKKGVKRNKLAFVLKEQLYVDAYRWRTLPPHPLYLGDPDYPYQPVTEQANAIAKDGPKFAYDELLMAALVIAVSGIPADPALRFAARVVLARFEAWIHEILTAGKSTMMCTEVVCTSFWRGKPSGHYAINIRVGEARAARLREMLAHPVPPRVAELSDARLRPSRADYEELRREFVRLVQGAARLRLPKRSRALGEGVLEPAGGPWLPLGCVTPHDLQRSPNLEFVGRLH